MVLFCISNLEIGIIMDEVVEIWFFFVWREDLLFVELSSFSFFVVVSGYNEFRILVWFVKGEDFKNICVKLVVWLSEVDFFFFVEFGIVLNINCFFVFWLKLFCCEVL